MKQVIQTRDTSLRTVLRRVWQLAGLLILLGWGSVALAQAVGVVTHLSGVLTVRHLNGSTVVLAVKSQIQQGDTLITEANTYARVKFLDNAEIVLRPGSELVVKTYLYEADKPAQDSVSMKLVKGGLRAVTGLLGKRNHDAVSFETPTATIGIRGTNYGALYCQNDCGGVPTSSGKVPENGLHVDVTQGAIVVANDGGKQEYGVGQFGFVSDSKTAPIVVPPAQGVSVTMPTSISTNAPGAAATSPATAADCP